MRNKWKKIMVTLIPTFFLLLGIGRAEEKSFELRWGTAPPGGSWQILCGAMLEDIKKDNPEGSGHHITGACLIGNTTVNVMGVHTGEFNVGVGASDNTARAWNGEAQFEKSGKIRDIFNISANFPFGTHIVVRADSDIHSIADLRGKRVSTGPKGVSSTPTFAHLLRLYGMTFNDVKIQFLSFTDGAQQFIDGHLDCLAYATVPPPFSAVVNVVAQRKVRFLSIPEEKISKLIQIPGYRRWTIPPGVYEQQGYPIHGVMSRCHLLVREDIPDWVVYRIVKTRTERHERYQKLMAGMRFVEKEDIAEDVGIPFHPAAVKYYKEIGLMK